jgi:SsrA-binding protein
MAKKQQKGPRSIATNRKALHDYFIEEKYEAGIVLRGSEVKSIRAGRVNLRDSYVRVKNGELWLIDTHIAPYDQASIENHDPRRERKLLMKRKEINRLDYKAQAKGLTVIPLRMYFSNNRIKLEIALAQGKQQYDKRAAIAKRDSDRQMRRALHGRYDD